MASYEQNSVNLTLVGAVPLHGALRDRVLDALASHDLAPTGYGWSDNPARPFDRNARALRERKEILWLVRDAAPAYRLTIFGWPTPTLWMRVPAPVDAPLLARLARLADDLAALTTPDIGWLSNRFDPADGDESEDARTQCAMNHAASGQPQWYRHRGPGGLALRTYLGPFLLDQIGRALVATLPAPSVVTDLPWGGVRIDLVGKNLDAGPEVVLPVWRRACAHLEAARFFTRVVIGAKQSVRFVPPDNPTRDPGGRAR